MILIQLFTTVICIKDLTIEHKFWNEIVFYKFYLASICRGVFLGSVQSNTFMTLQSINITFIITIAKHSGIKPNIINTHNITYLFLATKLNVLTNCYSGTPDSFSD